MARANPQGNVPTPRRARLTNECNKPSNGNPIRDDGPLSVSERGYPAKFLMISIEINERHRYCCLIFSIAQYSGSGNNAAIVGWRLYLNYVSLRMFF